MQRRARFTTDAQGRYAFRTVQPVSYPGAHRWQSVGDLLLRLGRHPFRPAHIHTMIAHPGCATLVTHVFVAGDSYLSSDAVFGVKDSLVVDFKSHPPGMAPDGGRVERPFDGRLRFRPGACLTDCHFPAAPVLPSTRKVSLHDR